MSTAAYTKKLLADSLKSMMNTVLLEKISVEQLTRQCGISRNTFYYHFQDKYQLVSWIFYQEATPILRHYGEAGQWADGLLALCRHMRQERSFYTAAFRYEGQNSLTDSLLSLCRQIIDGMLVERAVTDSWERQVVASFYAHALSGTIVEWARAGMPQDPEQAVEIIRRLFHGEYFWKSIPASDADSL